MQQLNPSEISEIIKGRIDKLDVTSQARNEGTVVSVSDGIVRIHGLAEKVGQQLREAKAQAAEIIEQAKKRGNQIVEEAVEKARIDADRVKVQAQAEIEQELNGVKDALRAQLGVLAVGGAEKILGATIDQNAHAELVNKLAAEI